MVAVFTLIAAKSAAKAARQARQAILENTLGEEINSARTLAAEVANLVDLGKLELARLRCNDLHDCTLTVLNRWERTLSTDSKNKLLNAKTQLELLRAAIIKHATNGATPTARQLLQMQVGCGQIRDVFVEEHASAMKRNDEADNALSKGFFPV